MRKSPTIEKSFKQMLDNNSNKMCINAIEFILDEFENDNIDTSAMREMVKKKKKSAQVCILPLPITKKVL